MSVNLKLKVNAKSCAATRLAEPGTLRGNQVKRPADTDHPRHRVMLYTPRSEADLKVVFQLIVESYNYVTGSNLIAADYMKEPKG